MVVVLFSQGDLWTTPDAPRHLVEWRKGSGELSYSRLLDTPEFSLDVGVEDGPCRWEAPFWFYILPIPQSYASLATKPVSVNLVLEPKSSQITLNPWKIFFVGTNELRVPPGKIWQDGRWLGTNTAVALPITNGTKFLLEFSPWDRLYPDRKLPFQLSIEGIRVFGRGVPLRDIAFKPTAFIRSEFRLPY